MKARQYLSSLGISAIIAAALSVPVANGKAVARHQDSADVRVVQPMPLRTAQRPNVIVILADDMGYSDLGLFGSGIRTPNLDALARDGLLFTQFYNEAKCTESRSALLSGRPSRAVLSPPPKGSHADAVLARDVPTLADAMRARGYKTMISGKWHLGETAAYWPDKRGFDRSFSLVTGASSYFEMRMREAQDDPELSKLWPAKPFMVKDGARWEVPASGFYMTDAIGDAARSMIRDHASTGPKDPFFLYLAFTAPHFPLHALPEDIARYKGRFDAGWEAWREKRLTAMKDRGIVPRSAKLATLPAEVPQWRGPATSLNATQRGEWARRMEVFAAQLDRLDQNVGKLIADLKAQGLYDNTLILFLSDNGAASMSPEAMARDFGYVTPGAVIGTRESNTSYGEPWAATSNTPLRNYKQSLYEGGIRTPLIVSWPAGLRKHGLTEVPGQILDLYPTLVSVAGGTSVPAAVGGTNLAPMLANHKVPTPARFWAFHAQAAVRDGNWKLVSPDRGKTWQLFDLGKDPGENIDLAQRYPSRVSRMAGSWHAWSKAAGKPYSSE